jgi:PAS domain S-box-containing protein
MNKNIDKLFTLLDKNVTISETDENGIIINVSEAFCKISGYTKDELIGQPYM